MSEIKIGLIGGTGIGAAMAQAEGRRHEIETPFGRASDAIVEIEWSGLPVLFLNRHGPGHLFNPSAVPYRANIFALKQLGCTHIIATGAVGSLRDEYKPRQLVIPDQIIDKTFRRAGTFYDQAAVHVEFAEPFCPVLRRILIESAADQTIHPGGCYVCMEGPAFSTRAESLMHRLWGGDLIGMTCMPEAKLAREAEISYALIALVTDYDCWKQPASATKPDTENAAADAKTPDAQALLKEIIANVQVASDSAMQVIRRAVESMTTRVDELKQSPAQRALELAIWSDRTKISQDERHRLAPLWQKYF